MGCGSSSPTKNDAALGGSSGSGGAIGSGGSGGSVADANTAIDLGAGGGSDGSTGVDLGAGGSTSPIDGPPSNTGGRVDCSGLTPAQCHDLIINPTTLPDGVVPQDPGPNPTVPYPNCAAI
jgi:hypothetical protein